MFRAYVVTMILVTVLASAITPCIVAGVGNDGIAEIRVAVPSSVFITVNGTKHYGAVFKVKTPAHICLLDMLVYEKHDTRYRFAFWVKGDRYYSNKTCIDILSPGTYTAIYRNEYLVTIVSSPLLFTDSYWVPSGYNFTYTAPQQVKKDNILYRFKDWSGGAISLSPTISLTITQPTTIIAEYIAYYPLYLNNTLIGYFPAGYTYYYSTNPIIRNNTKLVVTDLVVYGASYTKISDNVFAIQVKGVTKIIPVYKKFYLVKVSTLEGTITSWVPEGETYTLKAQPIIDYSDVRYVFERWVGDVNSTSYIYTVKVYKPLIEYAVYVEEYRVTIISPLGEKTKYVRGGETLYVYEPPELPGLVTSRVLKGFIVNGKFYEPTAPGVLILRYVDKPLTVVAIYEDQIIWVNVAIIAGFISLIIAGYIIYSLVSKSKKE